MEEPERTRAAEIPTATPVVEGAGAIVREQRQVPPALRWVVLAGFVLVLLLIVNFSGNVRARHAQEKAFAQGVDGMAGLLVDPFLQAQLAAVGRAPARLQRTAEAIAAQGRFAEVTITDADGRVLATTDTTLAGRTLEAMKTAPSPTRVTRPRGRLTGERGVFQPADRRLGAVRVVVAP